MSVLEDYGNEPVGFLQFFNSWKKNTEIRRFLSTSGLAEAAAELLGCKQVRLYQVGTLDLALFLMSEISVLSSQVVHFCIWRKSRPYQL